MEWIEIIKILILGIVEGITEWLPISSTGHMILVDEFIKLNVSHEFMAMFLVVIQLGAILAVVVLYWKKLFPITFTPNFNFEIKILNLWCKIVVACLPAGVIGILYDDLLDSLFYNSVTVASTLIIYGVLFVIIEKYNQSRKAKINSLDDLSYGTAFLIGLFQVLSLIPGTSRSGATIIGGILLGTSRTIAAEFTFFLAIPVMVGASLLKIYKFGFHFTSTEAIYLITGMVSAFFVSILAIKFLVGYIKKHDFAVFGWYRIILGLLVLVYFFH